jgi:cytochrome P450
MRDSIPVLPLSDPDYWQNPYPVLRALREQHRVAQNEEGHVVPLHWQDAAWAVKGTDFIAEGIEVLERRGFKPGDPLHTWRSHAIGVKEGDDHRRVRSQATSALSKRNMDGLRPLIRKHAHALLDRALGTGAGELDVHRDYASPLPRLVMMDFLGITGDELSSSFASMSRVNIVDCFGPRVTPELRAAANDAIQKSMDHVARLYEKRRQEPRDDLLTHLVQAKDEGGELSHGELITLFSTIFGSGASTTSVLASGILELARQPEQAALFRSDPERWKRGACEETLRYRPAIIYVGQKSAVAQEAFGLAFEKDEPIAVALGPRQPGSRALGGSRALRPPPRPGRHVAHVRHGGTLLPGARHGAGDPRGGPRLLRRALRRALAGERAALDPVRDGEQARPVARALRRPLLTSSNRSDGSGRRSRPRPSARSAAAPHADAPRDSRRSRGGSC